MSPLRCWFQVGLALAVGAMIAWPRSAHAQPARLPLQSVCDRDTVFADGRPMDLDWQPLPGNVAKVPIQTSCWIRITRPSPSTDAEVAANQFLVFENSWGSDWVLYGPSGQRVAESSVAGTRYRLIVDRIWVIFPLDLHAPEVLYAKVTSLHRTSTVRHSVYQMNADRVLQRQRSLFHGAAAWLLFVEDSSTSAGRMVK